MDTLPRCGNESARPFYIVLGHMTHPLDTSLRLLGLASCRLSLRRPTVLLEFFSTLSESVFRCVHIVPPLTSALGPPADRPASVLYSAKSSVTSNPGGAVAMPMPTLPKRGSSMFCK